MRQLRVEIEINIGTETEIGEEERLEEGVTKIRGREK